MAFDLKLLLKQSLQLNIFVFISAFIIFLFFILANFYYPADFEYHFQKSYSEKACFEFVGKPCDDYAPLYSILMSPFAQFGREFFHLTNLVILFLIIPLIIYLLTNSKVSVLFYSFVSNFAYFIELNGFYTAGFAGLFFLLIFYVKNNWLKLFFVITVSFIHSTGLIVGIILFLISNFDKLKFFPIFLPYSITTKASYFVSGIKIPAFFNFLISGNVLFLLYFTLKKQLSRKFLIALFFFLACGLFIPRALYIIPLFLVVELKDFKISRDILFFVCFICFKLNLLFFLLTKGGVILPFSLFTY